MKHTLYKTKGTCSQYIDVTVDEDGVVREVSFWRMRRQPAGGVPFGDRAKGGRGDKKTQGHPLRGQAHLLSGPTLPGIGAIATKQRIIILLHLFPYLFAAVYYGQVHRRREFGV